MLNDSIAAAQHVNETLQEAEANMDSTIDSVARCVSRMVRARQRARLPLCAGQEAIDAMVQSLVALSTARRDMIASHAGLRQVADDLNVPPMAFGDACPPGQASLKTERERTPLHVVA